MVTWCAAYNCTNGYKKGSGISFHKFPLRNAELLGKWLAALKRENFMPTHNHKLCSTHFTKSCFWISQGNRLLKYNAVPTIFNFPSHSVKTRKLPQKILKTKEQSDNSDINDSCPSLSVPEVHNYTVSYDEANQELMGAFDNTTALELLLQSVYSKNFSNDAHKNEKVIFGTKQLKELWNKELEKQKSRTAAKKAEWQMANRKEQNRMVTISEVCGMAQCSTNIIEKGTVKRQELIARVINSICTEKGLEVFVGTYDLGEQPSTSHVYSCNVWRFWQRKSIGLPKELNGSRCTAPFPGLVTASYRFPFRSPQLVRKWVKALKKENFVPSRHHKLCSVHFEESCFWKSNGKRILKDDAVPTIFNFSEHKKCHFESQLIESKTEDRDLQVDTAPTVFGYKLREKQIKKSETGMDPQNPIRKKRMRRTPGKKTVEKESSWESSGNSSSSNFSLRTNLERKRRHPSCCTDGERGKRIRNKLTQPENVLEEYEQEYIIIPIIEEQKQCFQVENELVEAIEKEETATQDILEEMLLQEEVKVAEAANQDEMPSQEKARAVGSPNTETVVPKEKVVPENKIANKVWCRLDEICRLCIKKCYKPVNLYQNDLAFKIQAISCITDMDPADGLPIHVCQDCREMTNICYSFKLQCEAADESLKTCIKSLQIAENNDLMKQQNMEMPLPAELSKCSSTSSDESENEDVDSEAVEEKLLQKGQPSPSKMKGHSVSNALQDELYKACTEFSDDIANVQPIRRGVNVGATELKQLNSRTRKVVRRKLITKSVPAKSVVPASEKQLHKIEHHIENIQSSYKLQTVRRQTKPPPSKVKQMQCIGNKQECNKPLSDEQKQLKGKSKAQRESATKTAEKKPEKVNDRKTKISNLQLQEKLLVVAESNLKKANGRSEHVTFLNSNIKAEGSEIKTLEPSSALKTDDTSKSVDIYQAPNEKIVKESSEASTSASNKRRILTQDSIMKVQEHNGHLVPAAKQDKAQLCHVEIFKVQKLNDNKVHLNKRDVMQATDISLHPVTQASTTKLFSLANKLEENLTPVFTNEDEVHMQNGESKTNTTEPTKTVKILTPVKSMLLDKATVTHVDAAKLKEALISLKNKAVTTSMAENTKECIIQKNATSEEQNIVQLKTLSTEITENNLVKVQPNKLEKSVNVTQNIATKLPSDTDDNIVNENELCSVKRNLFHNDNDSSVSGASLPLCKAEDKKAVEVDELINILETKDETELPQDINKLMEHNDQMTDSDKLSEKTEDTKGTVETNDSADTENKSDKEEIPKMKEDSEEYLHKSQDISENEFSVMHTDSAEEPKISSERKRGLDKAVGERQCHICAKSFPQSALQRHIASHWSQKDLLCEKCGISFFFPADLERHIISHCPQEASSSREDSVPEKKPLKVRLRTFTCGACGIEFTNWFQLRDHKLIHKKGKRHKCRTCRKHFRTKYLLQSHTWIHSVLKSPSCNICGKTFSLPWYVERHLQEEHS